MARIKIKRYLVGEDPKSWSLMAVFRDLEMRGMTEYEADKISRLEVGETYLNRELPDVKRIQ